MARPVTPLDDRLPAVLSRREILAAGHGKNRESRTDLVRVGHGLYRRAGEGRLLPPGAEAFKKDNPNAEVKLVESGHFAL